MVVNYQYKRKHLSGAYQYRVYGMVKSQAREEGIDSLSPKPKPGRRRKLTEKEEQEVKRWIVGKNPRQYNFDFCLWTRKIVSDLILDRIGIKLSVNSVGRLLHRQGLTPQKPLRRAYERNPEATDKWVKEDYVRIRSRAKQRKAEIFWLDEASIRSDDPLQRTWGPKLFKLVGKGSLLRRPLVHGLYGTV